MSVISTDAERIILSGLVAQAKDIILYLSDIDIECFGDPYHRNIFAAIDYLYSNNRNIDILALKEYFCNKPDYDIHELIILDMQRLEASTYAIKQNLPRLQELKRKRMLIALKCDIDALLIENEKTSAEILDLVETSTYNLRLSTQNKDYEHITENSEYVFENFMKYNDMFQNGEIPLSEEIIPYNNDYLFSKYLGGGFAPGNLIIVAARAGLGKTSFALNIAQNLTYAQIPVLFCSLEMSKAEMIYKTLSINTGVEITEMRSGRFTIDKKRQIIKEWNKLKNSSLYIDDTGTITVDQIKSKALKFFAKHGAKGLLIIDYLNLIKPENDFDNRATQINTITRKLKLMAKDLNIPIIALCQINRGTEQRHNKKPMLSDLKESGGIEEHANQVIALYRDNYYNKDIVDNTCEVIFLKNRLGQTGSFEMGFDTSSGKFSSLGANNA